MSLIKEKKGTWITYRPDIKVLDCTIRDGGLINNYQFGEDFVRAVYDTCVEIGVDYMEIGKIASPKVMSTKEFGPWNFCLEEDLRSVVGSNETPLKLAVMADIGRTFKENIRPREDSVVDMVRVAAYIHQIPAAIELIEDAHSKGYETTINLMAISKVSETDLDEALDIFANTNVDVIYLVDSFGTYYSEQIHRLVKKYLNITEQVGKKVGIHAHNNQQLAYANTIESLIMGTSYLDATVYGLGRGAGNCPLELLMGFLKNPKYNIVPLLKLIEKYVKPLHLEMNWGYDIPYMLVGQLNEHPRTAIEFIKNDERDFVKLHNTLLDMQP
ncbi:isopropylmalate/homocitrate/citramalate synthase [Clostridium aceticum]|uniref:Isopropylmalate/homocitrate/citramalate synthase n=1 Tax=Clostridium aceticum TaxID=84022 RepID=A0A0D8IDS9_9CLOT|nr:aldolase catalytic domain-containing protein [Clostridium aceticum]AKL94195.1 isopropylmalate/homocitrate/citramalate synthase [Clostridium aceticum]KJF28465.1 nucleoid-structuring protein H-NS [Clostridium aceticum]